MFDDIHYIQPMLNVLFKLACVPAFIWGAFVFLMLALANEPLPSEEELSSFIAFFIAYAWGPMALSLLGAYFTRIIED